MFDIVCVGVGFEFLNFLKKLLLFVVDMIVCELVLVIILNLKGLVFVFFFIVNLSLRVDWVYLCLSILFFFLIVWLILFVFYVLKLVNLFLGER